MKILPAIRQKTLTVLYAMAILLLFAASPGFAQVIPTGVISGVAKDPAGALVAHAVITVVNTDSSSQRTTMTDNDGAFRFPALPTGRYSVRAELTGFKTSVQTGVSLDVAQEAVVNFTMQVGAVNQEVTVKAESERVDTTTSSLGHIVDNTQINELPLNGRNFIDLTLLQTGINQFQNNTFGTNALYGTFFSSNGAPLRSNMYTLDGAIMGNIQGASASSISGLSLGLDGISEYRVMTNSFSAEYGLTMGSQTTIVTRGGTNRFHGDVFEYFRNSVLDARNYFDALYTLPTSVPGGGRRVAPFKRNQFGGAIGGPIKKDKTFFFATYEGFRETLDNPPNIGVTPTIPAACHTPIVGGVQTVTNACDAALAPGKTEDVLPSMQAILALWPIPNIEPGDSFTYLSTEKTKENYIQGRIDHVLTTKDSMFGRYTIDDTNETYPRIFPIFDTGLVERQQYFTLAENHVFTPSLLNSARFSYSRSRVLSATPSASNPTTAMLSGPLYSCRGGLPICPFNISSIANFSNTTSTGVLNVQSIYSVGDDIFWTKGKNGIKLGALINHYNQYANEAGGQKGTVSFASLQAFLLGKYRSYTTYDPNYNSLKDMLFNTVGFYGQDDYRVAPRVTLNLGLRYEFNTTPNEKNGRQSYFAAPPYSNTVSLGQIVNNPSYGNVSPRVGFAWDIFGTGKTSAKGGFAILYDLSNLGAVFGLAGLGTPPYVTSYVVTPTLAAQVGLPTTLTFPFPIPPSTTNSTAPGAGGSPTSINRDYKSPHMFDYNFAIEQQLSFNTILNVAYAGSRGKNLFQPAKEVNPYCPLTNTFIPQGCTSTVVVAGAKPTWAPTGGTRLNPFYSNFALFDTGGESLYNSLQVNLTKRVSRGLQFQVAYTYAKFLDNTEGVANADTSGATPGQFEDPFDANVDYGPSNFDIRHNLHGNVVYHLPKLTDQPLKGKFVNGWWVGSIVSFQTGQPFSPSISTDRENSGIAGTNGGLERPSLVTSANIAAVTAAAGVAAGITTCPANSSGCLPYIPKIFDPKTVITHRVDQWFDPNMFTLQAFGTVGDVARNILREPGLVNWDFSLNKNTALRALGEGGSVEFRTEVFNILNHTNFGPSRNGGFFSGSAKPQAGQTVAVERPNPTGLFSTSTPSREIQFSLKVIF